MLCKKFDFTGLLEKYFLNISFYIIIIFCYLLIWWKFEK